MGVLACACVTTRGSVARAQAIVADDGVSHVLAQSRAARLSDLHYDVRLTLAPHAATMPAEETLRFNDTGSGDLLLDYRDGELQAATLNNIAIATTLEHGHLRLPAKDLHEGANTLTLRFTSNIASVGKAITRYEDRDDHSEYFYSLFVPMDASMAIPCFDQPDLKARFSLKVTAPSAWTVIANTAPAVTKDAATSVWSFPASEPISTYLFAFAAGPWAAIHGAKPGQPTLYVRQSQLARAKAEAPQVQQMAARGIAYFADYFAQPFPFPKYDLVLIPGFPFGGMEHAGETFLNEDGVLFRSAPTATDYFHRNILVLHETCHQWFGDRVTMRWFDDLWLKEGFAQYMAYKALAQLEPTELPWKHFYEEIKPAAYGIDETQGTTPIFQDIPNLKDAKSAYGAIVYQKAPSVLKSLNYFLGEASFRDGLRLYQREHGYANATWADLIGAFERASRADGEQRDVQGWARAWILQRGMPEVRVAYSCRGGRLASLTLTQKDALGTEAVWPMSHEVLLLSAAGAQRLPVRWSTPSYEVKAAEGKPCPALVFANENDDGYGRILLDGASARTAATLLNPESKQDMALRPALAGSDHLLRRSMLWGALWDNVHVAQAAPQTFVDLALAALPSERDEALTRIESSHSITALHDYMSDVVRAQYVPRLETVLYARMLQAPEPGLRIVSFRSFSAVAETPTALAQVKSLLTGATVVPGMPLKPLDRWSLIGHLVAMNDPQAASIYATEKAHDHSGEGQKYAYAVAAGAPDAAVKARYFDGYLHDSSLQEDWITQSLRPFNSWNQSELTAPYLPQALDALESIKQHRKIFFLGAWLGAFMDGQHSATAQAEVHGWLDRAQLDPDLRRKVLENLDGLDRAVMIRAKFPQD
jgi:aminopeptidase N